MSNYINNIENCSLEVFRKVMNTGNYELLLIDGKHNDEEAKSAWLELYDEWQENVISKTANIQFEITKQVEIKRLDYQIIQNCLGFISILSQINLQNQMFNDINEKEIVELIDIDGIITILNKYKFRFDKEKGIVKELERVERQSENILSQIKMQIEKLEKQNESNSKNDFDDTIAAVEKYMSFPISEKIMVKKFISYLNMLIKSQTPKE